MILYANINANILKISKKTIINARAFFEISSPEVEFPMSSDVVRKSLLHFTMKKN